MSIITKDITKIYGKQKALDAVSLEINVGEVVGLLGPNGSDACGVRGAWVHTPWRG